MKVPNVVCKRYACASDMSAVTFSIDVPKTIDGEMIYLVGGRKDGSEVGAGLLGNWEPPTAVPMNTSNGIEWSVTVSLPRGTAYEFKFVKTSFQRPEDPGFATFQWEPGQNRTVNVPNAATHSWSDQVNPVTEWDDEVKSLN